MSLQRDAEVIVVGAGPAGAATAWALAKEGVDVLVLDRARFPRDKICAEYLSPQASRILSDMGVLEEIERSGPAHLAGMRLRAPNGLVANGEFAANHGFHGFRDKGLAIRRTILDEIVLRGARSVGARVEEGVRVTDVVRNSGARVSGVSTIGPNGVARTLRSHYIVGADGLRSVIGRRLGLVKTSRIWPRRIALVAHYRKVQGVTDMGEMHVDYDGYFGIVDVGDGKMNVAVVIPMSRANVLRPIRARRRFFRAVDRFAAASRRAIRRSGKNHSGSRNRTVRHRVASRVVARRGASGGRSRLLRSFYGRRHLRGAAWRRAAGAPYSGGTGETGRRRTSDLIGLRYGAKTRIWR